MSILTHDVSTPTGEPASNAWLNEETVLHVLDFEIDRIVAEQSRPGWSLWALCGGLAAILWLLIEQFTSTDIHLVNTLQLFVALSIVMSARHFLNYLQGFGQTKPARSPRFQWAPDSTNKLTLLISAIKNAFIVFIALTLTSGIHWYYSWITILIYGLIALMGLVALILSLFRIPVSSIEPRLEGRAQIVMGVVLWILCLVILGSIIFGYLSAVSSSPASISGADVRTAMLLVALIFLLRLMAEDYSSSPLLVSLIQTRRDLAFGRVSLDTAIEQAEIAILGMNETTVLQENLRSVLQQFESAKDLLVQGDSLVGSLRVTTNNQLMAGETRSESMARLKEIGINYEGVIRLLEKQIKVLDRKGFFLGDTPSSRAAFVEIKQRLAEARNSLADREQRFASTSQDVIAAWESVVKAQETQRERLTRERDRLIDELARKEERIKEAMPGSTTI